MGLIVLIRGGGDLASGVALRLFRSGINIIILELARPLVVRRKVSFAEAVYTSHVEVEGVRASTANDLNEAFRLLSLGNIPVIVDPEAKTLIEMHHVRAAEAPIVLVDGRMTKQPPEPSLPTAALTIGLGPGFTAGVDCDAVIETNRGHLMGRVIWQGSAERDTGIPESVVMHAAERVIRAPVDGILTARSEIGDQLEKDQIVAEVSGLPIHAPFRGVLRGLIYPGMQVKRGMKVGDIDPRGDPRFCFLVSDKSLAVGGGVLEAMLSQVNLRKYLWE